MTASDPTRPQPRYRPGQEEPLPKRRREFLLSSVRSALEHRYDIEREIGHGGMATVFAGFDRALDRPVAVKVLRPEFAATLVADRFQREIDYLSTLDHANILPVLDSGKAREILYFTMPYAHGASLRTRIDADGALDIRDACAITRDIASAIDHAHEHNIIHRDIKPENVVFHDGRTWVCDFGIARAIVRAGGDRLSSSGLVVGTPQYMSPEQGVGDEISGASDIYALGCVSFEMLVGETPFSGTNPQAVIARHVRDAPPKLRIVRPEISESVQEAVEWALRKDPADRPHTATAYAEALAGGLDAGG